MNFQKFQLKWKGPNSEPPYGHYPASPYPPPSYTHTHTHTHQIKFYYVSDTKIFLTLSWQRPLSYRNQSIDLRSIRNYNKNKIPLLFYATLVIRSLLSSILSIFFGCMFCFSLVYWQFVFSDSEFVPLCVCVCMCL